MIGYPKFVVRDKDVNPTFSEVLLGVDPSSVTSDRTLNQTYSVTFSVYEFAITKAAYNMVSIGHWIVWDGQLYQISNMEADVEDGVSYKQVTAINCWFATKRIEIDYWHAGKKDYHASELLKIAFDGNHYGYSYKLVGDDKPTVNIEDLGEITAYDVLTKYIIGELNLCVIPKGKMLNILSLDNVKRDTGQTLFYYHNTTQISAQFDIRNLINCIHVYGAVKDKDKHTYVYETVIRNEESIKLFGECWGEAVHDDDIKDLKSAQAAVADTMSATPEVSISTNLKNVSAELGDVYTLRTYLNDDIQSYFETGVMVNQITSTPYTGDPATIVWTKGVKNVDGIKTFADMQAKQEAASKQLSHIKENQDNMSTKLNSAYQDRLSGRVINEADKIVKLESPVDNPGAGMVAGQQYYVATKPAAIENLDPYLEQKYQPATPTSDGLMSAEDKKIIEKISEPKSEVLMKSPDGSIFVLTVDDEGNVKATKQDK